MIPVRSACLAIVLACALPATAQQARVEPQGPQVLRLLNRVAAQYALLLARSFVDLTYQTVTIEPGTNDLTLTGLRLYPQFDWDRNGACEITIDRLVAADVTSFDTLQVLLEMSGVEVPLACLDPLQASTVAGLGYDILGAERVSVELAFDLPSSAADVVVQAAIAGAGELSLAASFDYLWIRLPQHGDGDPEPVALLGQAELAFENTGIWERIEPTVIGQLGDPAGVPQMAEAALLQVFGEAGTRQTSDEERGFARDLGAEIGRFLRDRDRIVVTAAPAEPVWIEAGIFESLPAAFAALQPEVSGVPHSRRGLIAPGRLEAALSGGDGLDDAERLAIGSALITGVGAPRAVAEGRALLAPLAADWNAEAAALLASAAEEDGDLLGAYAYSLRAMAGGAPGAAGLADELEIRLPLGDVVAAQEAAGQSWPGTPGLIAESDDAIARGDVNLLRKLAYRAASGQEMPRNLPAAYYWATLAAAAGDRGAAGLRRRMDARFGGRNALAWRPIAARAAAQALETWTTGGLGQRLYPGDE